MGLNRVGNELPTLRLLSGSLKAESKIHNETKNAWVRVSTLRIQATLA
ncbi:hypothetical protein ACKLNO_11565 [Neisseriaceae bacterium B1]